MTRIRSKYSIFCQKRPVQPNVKEIAVYLKDSKQWVECVGKIYAGGRVRYWYNGVEGSVGAFGYKDLTGCTDVQRYEMLVSLNMRQLEYYHPAPAKQSYWHHNDDILEILQNYVRPQAAPPVVEQEPPHVVIDDSDEDVVIDLEVDNEA